MDRNELFEWVKIAYGTEPDYPWNDKSAVLRHADSGKWYGAVVAVSEKKLGLVGDKIIDVLNVKCGPIMAGPLREKNGIFPAYHMNKESWVSIALDGSVSADEIKSLVELSRELTAVKKKKGRK